MERDKLEDEYNTSDFIRHTPLTPFPIPFPEEGQGSKLPFPLVRDCLWDCLRDLYYPLAPWGEDAHRAGEGPLVRGRLSLFNYPLFYEKINLNPNDSYESKCIGASP